MPKKNTPPYVQRLYDRHKKVRGYRGWATFAGKRKFGPVRREAHAAHKDAMTMRGMLAAPSFGGAFETRANQWLAEIRATRTADTADFYESKLKAVYRTIPQTFGIDRITAATLGEFVREAAARNLGARTVQHCRRALNGLFVWCVKRGYMQDNPVAGANWPKPEATQPDVMTEAELADVLARITDPWAADLAMFIALTGLRRAEVARLRVPDVDAEGGALWVRGKTGSQAHPIPVSAVSAAKRLLAVAGEFLIPGKTDRARREKIADTFRMWQRKLAEPRFHPHALRHSVATMMLRNGENETLVQRFLRHSSIAMTKKYSHLVANDLHGATGRLRLVRDGPAEAQD